MEGESFIVRGNPIHTMKSKFRTLRGIKLVLRRADTVNAWSCAIRIPSSVYITRTYNSVSLACDLLGFQRPQP